MKRRLIALAAMLALLAQGIGGASAAAEMHAAPFASPAMAAEAAAPCHGEADTSAEPLAPAHGATCDCCDVSCALACAFIAITFAAPPAPVVDLAAAPRASGRMSPLLQAHTASPFRPPAA